MSKLKKPDYKKLLVRHSEQSLPKIASTESTVKEPQCSKSASATNQLLKENAKSSSSKMDLAKPKSQSITFDKPKINSISNISKKIEAVENKKPRQVKSVSDLDKKNKLAVDERITKHVNFPYDQPIYKDLIPLCTRQSEPPPVLVSRDPLPQKDIEPSLNDFLKPKVLQEYRYQVSLPQNQMNPIRQFNGLKLTKIMQNWT